MLINNESQSFQLGLDGFIWWIGVVESVIDPLGVGRCKVRIFGWHNDDRVDKDAPTSDELPWTVPVRPVTHSHMPSDVREGDWVVGFFLDGKFGQQPMMIGALPALPQTSLLPGAKDLIKAGLV